MEIVYIARIILLNLMHSFIHYGVMCTYRLFHEVSFCPRNGTAWTVRGNYLGCPIFHLSYHCLRTINDGFFEFCGKSLALDGKDGCPVIIFRNDIPQIEQEKCSGTMSECPDPHSKSTFSSKDTYKYPGCLRIKEISTERMSKVTFAYTENLRTSTITLSKNSKIFKDNGASTEKDVKLTSASVQRIDLDSEANFPSTYNYWIFVGVTGIVIIAFLLAFVGLLFKYIRKLKKDDMRYMTSVPYNSGTAHLYHDVDDAYDDVALPNQSTVEGNDNNPIVIQETKLNQSTLEENENSSTMVIQDYHDTKIRNSARLVSIEHDNGTNDDYLEPMATETSLASMETELMQPP